MPENDRGIGRLATTVVWRTDAGTRGPHEMKYLASVPSAAMSCCLLARPRRWHMFRLVFLFTTMQNLKLGHEENKSQDKVPPRRPVVSDVPAMSVSGTLGPRFGGKVQTA